MYPVKRRYRKQVGDVFLVPYDLDAEFEDNENGKYLPKPTDQVMIGQYFYNTPTESEYFTLFKGSYSYKEISDELVFWGMQHPIEVVMGVYGSPMRNSHFPFIRNAEVSALLRNQLYRTLNDQLRTLDGEVFQEYVTGHYPVWGHSTHFTSFVDVARFLNGLPTRYETGIDKFRPHVSQEFLNAE